jgi:hypothetical protein
VTHGIAAPEIHRDAEVLVLSFASDEDAERAVDVIHAAFPAAADRQEMVRALIASRIKVVQDAGWRVEAQFRAIIQDGNNEVIERFGATADSARNALLDALLASPGPAR